MRRLDFEGFNTLERDQLKKRLGTFYEREKLLENPCQQVIKRHCLKTFNILRFYINIVLINNIFPFTIEQMKDQNSEFFSAPFENTFSEYQVFPSEKYYVEEKEKEPIE